MARHSVRAIACLAKAGAHYVTRLTSSLSPRTRIFQKNRQSAIGNRQYSPYDFPSPFVTALMLLIFAFAPASITVTILDHGVP